MTQPLPPCPFCGTRLKPTRNGAAHGTIKEIGKFCFMAGHHIGSELLPAWCDRVPMHYTVEEGLPYFNDQGVGKPASVDKVNTFFAHVSATGRQ